MGTDADYMDFVADQAAGAGVVRYRKMFGEYAFYLDEKVVALVCGNAFYLKPTAAGAALLGTPVEGLPYPGAKPWYLLEAELEDREAFVALLRATAAALPLPAPKKTRAAKVKPDRRNS